VADQVKASAFSSKYKPLLPGWGRGCLADGGYHGNTVM